MNSYHKVIRIIRIKQFDCKILETKTGRETIKDLLNGGNGS